MTSLGQADAPKPMVQHSSTLSRTAGAIAAKVEQSDQLKLSAPTVKCHLRQNGLQHLSPVANTC